MEAQLNVVTELERRLDVTEQAMATLAAQLDLLDSHQIEGSMLLRPGCTHAGPAAAEGAVARTVALTPALSIKGAVATAALSARALGVAAAASMTDDRQCNWGGIGGALLDLVLEHTPASHPILEAIAAASAAAATGSTARCSAVKYASSSGSSSYLTNATPAAVCLARPVSPSPSPRLPVSRPPHGLGERLRPHCWPNGPRMHPVCTTQVAGTSFSVQSSTCAVPLARCQLGNCPRLPVSPSPVPLTVSGVANHAASGTVMAVAHPSRQHLIGRARPLTRAPTDGSVPHRRVCPPCALAERARQAPRSSSRLTSPPRSPPTGSRQPTRRSCSGYS